MRYDYYSANAVLNEKQNEWIKKTKEKIYSLLEETPPDGKHFASYIKVIIGFLDYLVISGLNRIFFLNRIPNTCDRYVIIRDFLL